MYKRILVATGGSPWSDAAVAYAIRLAADTGSEMVIATVLTTPVSYGNVDETGMGFDILVDSLEEEGKSRLLKAVTSATRAGVPCTTCLLWGNIPVTIVQTAAAEACDLIILGSRGVTGWKRLQLGSIGNAVAAKASQPVLVVKQSMPPMPAVSQWRRILVATGGSVWSEAALEHAIRLAQTQQSALCLLHVMRARSARGEEVGRTAGETILADATTRATAAGVPCTTQLADGNVVQAILDTAMREQCDGLILGSRGLSGWKRLMLGSVSNAVAAKALQPVLIVKPGEPVGQSGEDDSPPEA